ncbi:MAG: hypothetical protein HQK79_07115 [Desulfobacterales bacterium]|nr:hypothetical protein [Desulfobacterales bacterium]
MDAWFTSFFIENHLDHETYSEKVGSPEQVRFMVYLEEDEKYYPCSDNIFQAIINKQQGDLIQERYQNVLKSILHLINKNIEDEKEKKYLTSLIKVKYKHETRDRIMIPSRLEKRLYRIFLNFSFTDDPCMSEKKLRNSRAKKALSSDAFKKALNDISAENLFTSSKTLIELRTNMEYIGFKRFLSLTAEKSLWESNKSENYAETDYANIFQRKLIGNGVDALLDFLDISIQNKSDEIFRPKRILWLADESGEVLIDLAIIKYLNKLGHKIIIAFKDGPLFNKANIFDVQEDEILKKELEGAFLINDKQLTKNAMVQIFRGDNEIIAVSDGTQERLNLLLVSTTFSRIFKEVDAIISRGPEQKGRFFDTNFQFTQDIFNISTTKEGEVEIAYKHKHPNVIKFSHKDLERKAKSIISEMESEKKKGYTVVFYSGIIGSIPGQTRMAKKIMTVFIQYLKEQLSKTFIINPSQYFEPGMDADDLMYMWEIVQRSGFINIWRFQMYEDIVKAFQILDEKVPPEWVGKDATFSTGCTKEMDIALDVQKNHPEMQIIGPAKEKFMRRREYGVGKMFDARLIESCRI